MTRGQWEAMRAHVEAAAPLEACGLLAGREGRVEVVLEMRNAAESATRFRLDPRDQLLAFDRIETEGLQLLAIFHSHAAGPATPSATDIAEAAYEVVHIIWSQNDEGWKARGFHIANGLAVDVPLRVDL